MGPCGSMSIQMAIDGLLSGFEEEEKHSIWGHSTVFNQKSHSWSFKCMNVIKLHNNDMECEVLLSPPFMDEKEKNHRRVLEFTDLLVGGPLP